MLRLSAIALVVLGLHACSSHEPPVRCTWSSEPACVECIQSVDALMYYACQVCEVGAEPTRCRFVDESKLVLR